MKQDFWFKEYDSKDSADLDSLLKKGFFIVNQPMYNKNTGTHDFHLRRTLSSYLFRKFKIKN